MAQTEPYKVGTRVRATGTCSGPGLCRAVTAEKGDEGVIASVTFVDRTDEFAYVINWDAGSSSTLYSSRFKAFVELVINKHAFKCPLCERTFDDRKEGGADDPVCDSCWGHLHNVEEGLVWKDSATEIAGIRVMQADAGSVGFFVCVDGALRPGYGISLPCEKKDRDVVARRLAAATLILRGKDLPLGLVPVTMPWKKETK